ncbi:rRNA maturation RNase YbeY [Halomonas beimenensis]|uniref:Endoribonuclease YbeY n=1 Tax=Halomonas beimenensis TaxID=475662 RepID=A0A291P4R7_9GAMM|nr:rRNA maturation RNase YbeY [Halomonas beimenensis]ATJ81852.1 metal-dependent hydrolase YbeY, involved in rRNA and/or ribosome maturation and assembly [Halomonas beimenensis]
MTHASVDRQQALDADALPTQAELEAWVDAVLAQHPDEARNELTVRFVDAEESRALNRDYRDKDKPTNVLSFPFECPPGVALPLLGDLVICHPVVLAEARDQDKTAVDHYAHMVIHGTLHLLGYDHLEDDEAEVMEALERDILAGLGIDDPYLTPSPPPRDSDTEDERPDA